MKTPIAFILLSLAAAIPSYAQLCPSGVAFSQSPGKHVTSWRAVISHKAADGTYNPSSLVREKEIARVRQNMEDEIMAVNAFAKAHPDTPPIEFISAEGVREAYSSHSDGANGQMTVIRVGQVNKGASTGEGVLKGTLLTPVSGHTGTANALMWAKTNTATMHYEISLDSQGKTFPSYDGSQGPKLINNANSLGLVTAHEVSIPLVAGKVTRIYYFPSGSGGPGGYFDGRVIDFVWDGSTL